MPGISEHEPIDPRAAEPPPGPVPLEDQVGPSEVGPRAAEPADQPEAGDQFAWWGS